MYILNCGTLLCIIVVKQQIHDILHSLEYELKVANFICLCGSIQFRSTCSIRPCNLSIGFLPPDVDRPYMYVLVMTRSVGENLILLNVYRAKLYN